jgi:hypothetical protein
VSRYRSEYTTAQVAAFFGVDISTVSYWARHGVLTEIRREKAPAGGMPTRVFAGADVKSMHDRLAALPRYGRRPLHILRRQATQGVEVMRLVS